MPVLPFDCVTIYPEVRPLRLRDIERRQGFPHVQLIRPVITKIGWQRHNAVVLNPQDFSIIQIHHRHEAFDGSGVGVVLWIFSVEAVCPGMAEMFLLGLGEIRYGKALNKNLLGIRYPPTLKSCKEIRVFADDSLKNIG